MTEFFNMGGFGAYIWGAMLAALVLMVLEPLTLIISRRSTIKQIKRLKRLEDRQAREKR